MKMYSYFIEGLGEGQWRWTVFGDGYKAVKSGIAKGEHEAKIAALNTIDELKKNDAQKN